MSTRGRVPKRKKPRVSGSSDIVDPATSRGPYKRAKRETFESEEINPEECVTDYKAQIQSTKGTKGLHPPPVLRDTPVSIRRFKRVPFRSAGRRRQVRTPDSQENSNGSQYSSDDPLLLHGHANAHLSPSKKVVTAPESALPTKEEYVSGSVQDRGTSETVREEDTSDSDDWEPCDGEDTETHTSPEIGAKISLKRRRGKHSLISHRSTKKKSRSTRIVDSDSESTVETPDETDDESDDVIPVLQSSENPLSGAELDQIITALDISDEKLEIVFERLGIPFMAQRLPRRRRSKARPKESENFEQPKALFHKASTVSPAILQKYGWELDDNIKNKYLMFPGDTVRIKETLIYQPLKVEGDFKDVFDPLQSNKKFRPELNILRAMNRQRKRISQVDWLLRLPERWRGSVIHENTMRRLEFPPSFGKAFGNEENKREESPSTPKSDSRRSESFSPPSPFDYLDNNVAESPNDEAIESDRLLVEKMIADNQFEETPEGAAKLRKMLEMENSRRQTYITLHHLVRNSGSQYGVKYTTDEAIKEGDSKTRIGDATINEDAENPDLMAAAIVCRWARFTPILEKDQDFANAETEKINETRVETKVGPLLHGLFSDAMGLEEVINERTPFINALRLFATTSKPDYAARLSQKEWGDWTPLLAMILMYGEGKTQQAYNASRRPEAQLAMNGVAILVLFILMYLSTRERSDSEDKALPPWMYTNSFVYTERGFTIYGHHPKFVSGKWKFVSWKMSQHFHDVLTWGTSQAGRMRCLAAFFQMRSHTLFVLEQIREWKKNLPESVTPVMKMLIAKAHLDLKDEDWLRQKAEEKGKQ